MMVLRSLLFMIWLAIISLVMSIICLPLLAAPLAIALGTGFVMLRKQGKLPGTTVRHTYALEYGTDTIEIHKDAIEPGMNVLIVDDVLATGGTAAAAAQLVGKLGGNGRDRQRGGVGGQHRGAGHQGFELGKQLFFHGQVFDNRFNDDVSFFETGEIKTVSNVGDARIYLFGG